MFLCPEELGDIDNSNDSSTSDTGTTEMTSTTDVSSAKKKAVCVGSSGEEYYSLSEDSISCDSFKGNKNILFVLKHLPPHEGLKNLNLCQAIAVSQ